MKPKIKSAFLFAHGNVVVFDDRDQQIPELQEPPILIWAERAERLGYDIDGLRIECQGTSPLTLHKDQDGWTGRSP